MFIWDFVADTVLGQIVDWIYGQMIGFLGNFFSLMGQMGAELFELDWIQAIVLFFSQLAWVLYVVGLVVAVFECAKMCIRDRPVVVRKHRNGCGAKGHSLYRNRNCIDGAPCEGKLSRTVRTGGKAL